MSSLLNILALGFALFSLGVSIRNKWVFDRQRELNRFEKGVHLVRCYADYSTMMLKFWIWDVEKFKLPNEELRREP